MPGFIGQEHMNQIFEVVDALELSREAITVPLARKGDGRVERLPDGRIRIVVPDADPLDSWLAGLREQIAGL